MSGRRYDPPGLSNVGTFVFAHGAGAPETHPWMVAAAEGLAARGLRVVTFNFPYMEQPKRRAPDPPAVLQACFRKVVAHARAELADGERLFIGGKSLGGRMASHLAADGEPGIAGLVCLGYPLHPPGRPEQLRVKHLPGITVPVLIVQGSRDAFGTPAELGPHFAVIRARVTVHVVEGGDHSFRQPKKLAPDPKAALDRVLDAIVAWMRNQA